MPVREVTQLRLKGLSADDPSLLQGLSTYNCIGGGAFIYNIGLCPNLEAHLEFLASPARGEVLGPQEEILQFFVERVSVRGDCVAAFDQVVVRYTRQLQSSDSFKVTHGWRCDAATGSHEAVIFSERKTAQDHPTFFTNKSPSDSDNAAIDGQYETIQVTRAWNLERKKA
ncbi:hypothetical protein EJ02DRAFT_503860 [Clathrospora elynae]|uniref:Uncharacterized protein n=1 Tax=Clathrospora elynae TaxID=706981 RepID=A0A6A5SMH5_9PLEO|nr:hypothetical protein EJ02DRAFT_503860 [Clathrospora elynae]